MTKKKWPISTKNTLMGAIAIILAAVIGLGSCQKESPKIESTTNKGDTYIFQNIGNVEIPNMLPPSTTEKAVKELEKKLNQAKEKIELSKQDIEAFANALKDLDQRTSGIKKLPDGRTQIGQIVSGEPTIVIKQYSSAISYYKKNDFKNAFVHLQNAISAYEETEKIKKGMSVGELNKEFISVLYRLGVLLAQKLSKDDLAYDYAKKALNAESSPINRALLSTALANLNKYDEALKYIDEALEADSTNNYYGRLKQQYMEKLNNKNP